MVKSNIKKTGSGKQKKVFVDHQDVALHLAKSIGETQEGKTKLKIDKHHQHQRTKDSSARPSPNRNPRKAISGKKRLKEAKAIIVADQARQKKEKATLRKESRKLRTTLSKGTEPTMALGQVSRSNDDDPQPRPRKRVAFA